MGEESKRRVANPVSGDTSERVHQIEVKLLEFQERYSEICRESFVVRAKKAAITRQIKALEEELSDLGYRQQEFNFKGLE